MISSPVERMATIGLRQTSTSATPIAASTPVSRLVSSCPARSTVSPAVMSVPANETPLPGADRPGDSQLAAAHVGVLDHHDGVGAARHHAAGGDRQRLARSHRVCRHDAGVNLLVAEPHRARHFLGRAERVLGHHREAVDVRAVERRHVDGRARRRPRARGRAPRRAATRLDAARRQVERGAEPALGLVAIEDLEELLLLRHRARRPRRRRRRSLRCRRATMTKPSARVVEESTTRRRRPAARRRRPPRLHARVVEPADRRADLARQAPADRAVRPRRGASAERANRPAGEEVVGAQARHGIAGQQEHQPIADAAEAGRAARPHRDAVDRQLAVLRDQRRRQVFDADARAAGHDDDVGVGVQRVENRVGVVAHQAGEVDDAAVALDQRREHRPVGVGDVEAVRRDAGRQQLVAGDRRAARAAAARRRTSPTPIELSTPRSCGRSTRPRSSSVVPARDVFARAADVLARRHRRRARAMPPRLRVADRPTPRAAPHRAPRGIGAPVMMRTASPADTAPSNGRPGIESPMTVSGRRL